MAPKRPRQVALTDNPSAWDVQIRKRAARLPQTPLITTKLFIKASTLNTRHTLHTIHTTIKLIHNKHTGSCIHRPPRKDDAPPNTHPQHTNDGSNNINHSSHFTHTLHSLPLSHGFAHDHSSSPSIFVSSVHHTHSPGIRGLRIMQFHHQHI